MVAARGPASAQRFEATEDDEARALIPSVDCGVEKQQVDDQSLGCWGSEGQDFFATKEAGASKGGDCTAKSTFAEPLG